MFYAIPSRQCLGIDETAVRMLNGLGAQCKSTSFHTSSGQTRSFRFHFIDNFHFTFIKEVILSLILFDQALLLY